VNATQTMAPDRLIAAAVAETRLDDLGPDGFRIGLDVLCQSVVQEADLTDLGLTVVSGLIIASLTRRLRVIDWIRHHPAVEQETITAPLFVVGLFRAGTTLLSYLLDQDPANRSLLSWEAADSVPPPEPASHRAGPRLEAARARSGLAAQLNPGINAMHHEEADGPTECVTIMAQDFASMLWETLANVPTYADWLLQTDHLSTYAHHRRVLQLLQSGGVRGQWALKSPHHAIALDAIRAVYPDAVFVVLHRDPVVVTASACSLVGSLSGTFTDADHTSYIARRWSEVLEQSINRMDSFRSAHPTQPFIDVRYADLVRDPVATVRSIYDRSGRTLDPAAAAAMAEYIAAHPQGQFGTHRYPLPELGLDAGGLSDRFAAYITHYDVPRESPRA
jgi:Sulfotransferase family